MIKKLQIEGYRLLDGFEADLGDLTVVIGANGAGKSTLIECLQLISQCSSQPVNSVVAPHGGLTALLSAGTRSDKLTWRIAFSRSQKHALWESLPVKPGLELVYGASLAKDRSGTAVPDYEVLRYSEPFPGHDQPFKFLEALGGRRLIFDPVQKHFMELSVTPDDLSNGEEDLFAHIGGPPTEMPEGPSLMLSESRLFEKYPVPYWIRLVLTSLALYPGFRTDPEGPARRPSQLTPNPVLRPDGGNLAAVVHEIFTRHSFRESAGEIREFLRSAYPWVENVTAETIWAGPGAVTVRVHEAGMQRPMELWDLSDGLLRFLCLEAALLNPSSPPLVAIDEPEAGLHPRLLPIVADVIKAGSERTQVLVTTHSPELLQCFDLDHIAVMTREETRAKWYRPGTRESLRRMLEAVEGDTLADLHRSGELEAMP